MPADTALVERLRAAHPRSWDSLMEIQARFGGAGFKVFLVGGALRNLVLGTPLKDFDLASDALPQDVAKLFRHVIPTGIQHGTVTVVHRGEHFEITTFRVDGSYSDARRPDSVAFTPDILEDLKRRDFTINAMALDLAGLALLDPHGGRSDLAAGVVRTVGDPLERFAEDGLRIVRGIRFASQLGFHLEAATFAAMAQRLDRLGQVSVERFRDELLKILQSPQPSRGLYLLRAAGILPLFLGALAASPDQDFALGCLSAELLPPEPAEARLAAVLQSLDAPALAGACLSLKLSNQSARRVRLLHSLLDVEPDAELPPARLRAFAARAGRANAAAAADFLAARSQAREWLAYNRQDALLVAGAPPAGAVLAAEPTPPWLPQLDGLRRSPDPRLERFRRNLAQTLAAAPPLAVGDLAVDGARLIAEGFPPGPAMGRLLEHLLATVIADPAKNDAEALLAEARAQHESSH